MLFHIKGNHTSQKLKRHTVWDLHEFLKILLVRKNNVAINKTKPCLAFQRSHYMTGFLFPEKSISVGS